MGTLFYGAGRTEIEMDDVELSHLQQVVLNKLRRNEAFAVTLRPNQEELERLLAQANSTTGIVLESATLAPPGYDPPHR